MPIQESIYPCFPGVALGVVAAGSRRVTESMFLIAAKTLSSLVTKEQRAMGLVYPYLRDIRTVSAKIAHAVAEEAFKLGLATLQPKPNNLEKYVQEMQYDAAYPRFA